MLYRRLLLLSLAFLAAGASMFGCESQVVDAVDPQPDETGGTATGGSGASGGSGGAGGSGAAGGSTPSGGVSGSGTICPDGGSEADRDGDGALDCEDECPDDQYKQVRGLCGCGLPDVSVDDAPTCADLVALLAHRYAFNGYGEVVVDSAAGGDANGDVENTELTGQGTLVLAGGTSDQFAGLKNYLLSTLPAGAPETGSVTLEAWLRWNGGPGWQRIFDFGDNDNPMEGEQGGGGISYLFLTPRTPADITNRLRLTYKRPGIGEWEVTLDAEIALPSGVDAHVAVTVDGAAQRMAVYIDGVQQNVLATFRNPGDPTSTTMTGVYDWSAPVPTADGGMVDPPSIDLTAIRDWNNWLGRSQFIGDAELNATYYEFRIYSAALTPALVDISYRAGPDAVFLQ